MLFRATVRKPSELHSRWERELRTGGVVSGVQFRKVGGVYVSVGDPLPTDAVATLSLNNMIRLELSAAATDVQPPAEPVAPAAPPRAPEPEPPPPPPEPARMVSAPKAQPGRRVDLRTPQKGWPVGKG